MPESALLILVLATIVAIVVVPKWLASVASTAADRGIERASESHKARRPSRFWLIPAAGSASALRDWLNGYVEEGEIGGVSVELADRKGVAVVECAIAPGADIDAVRADLLRTAREADPGCRMEVP